MKLKSWKITKSENSEGQDDFKLNISVSGFDDEAEADSLLSKFKGVISRAGGQTSLVKDEE